MRLGWRKVDSALYGMDLFVTPVKEVTLYLREKKYITHNLVQSQYTPMQISHRKNDVDVKFFDGTVEYQEDLQELSDYLLELVK